MWEFEVDQKVVCINDEFEFTCGEKTPILGGIYTIREMSNDYDELCMRLYEIVNPEIQYGNAFCECWFLSHHFRPLKPTNIDVFKDILVKTPSSAEIELFTDDMYEIEKRDVYAL